MIFGSESLPLHQCDRAFQLVKAITGKKNQKKIFRVQLFMSFSQIFYEIMILYEFFFAKVKAPVLRRPLDASVSGTTAQVYVIKEQ